MKREPTVLAYHAIGSCPAEDDPYNLWLPTAVFERQMAYLAARRRVVSLDDVVEGTAPPGSVAITFDDAYESIASDALPVLRHHGLPGTVFVPTRWIGDRNRWDPPTARALTILDEDGLRALEAAGIRAESHGHGHIDLGQASAEAARADLEASCAVLRALLGRAPRHLAYPFKDGSPAAQTVAAELGFAAAFSIDQPGTGPWSRGRVQVTPFDGPVRFALKTSGWYLGLRHARLLASALAHRPRLRRPAPFAAP